MKSTSGYVFTLKGGTVFWKFTKKTCITQFNMEGKFIALKKASFEVE